MNRDELRANVDTIAFIMMENRSFDHILGHLSLPVYGGRTEVEGIRDLANPNFQNPSQLVSFRSFSLTFFGHSWGVRLLCSAGKHLDQPLGDFRRERFHSRAFEKALTPNDAA